MGADLAAFVELRVHAQGPALQLDETFSGHSTDESAALVFVGGSFAGESVLSRSAQHALEEALVQVRTRLREQLARQSPLRDRSLGSIDANK